MRRALLILCGLLIVVWGLPCQASAAVFVDDSTHLYNVVLGAGGGTYNVEFVNGYNADTLDFGADWQGWAQDAVNARLNDDGITMVGPTPSYQYIVPNKDGWPNGFEQYQYWQSSYDGTSSSWQKSYISVFNSGSIPGGIYADFTPASVPIPGAVWLLGSGLIGLVGIRRKIKT